MAMYGVFKIFKYNWLIFMIILGKYAIHDPYMDPMGMCHPCNFVAHSSTIKTSPRGNIGALRRQ